MLTVTGAKGVTEEGFASARKELEKRMGLDKANTLYVAWIQRLRLTRRVEVNPEIFPAYPTKN